MLVHNLRANQVRTEGADSAGNALDESVATTSPASSPVSQSAVSKDFPKLVPTLSKVGSKARFPYSIARLRAIYNGWLTNGLSIRWCITYATMCCWCACCDHVFSMTVNMETALCSNYFCTQTWELCWNYQTNRNISLCSLCLAGGCRWLQVAAGGCRWLQVAAGGCSCELIYVWLSVDSQEA